MCIIAIKRKGIELPKEEIFENCFSNNSDGAGFMYNMDGKVVIKKGFMTYKAFKDALNEALEEIKDVVNTGMVFHFRITTQGGTRAENCHPFPISNKEYDLQATHLTTNIGVAHNGIIDLTSGNSYGTYDYTLKKYVKKDTHLSDTQLFIRDYLFYIYGLNKKFYKSKAGLALVEKLIDSKMCFLDASGDIRTVGAFNEKDGMLYSNYTYSYNYSRGHKSKGRYGCYNSYDDFDNYEDDYLNWWKSYKSGETENKKTTDKNELAVGYGSATQESTVYDSSSKQELPVVVLTPIKEDAYYWGTSDEGGCIDGPDFYGIDKTGILYGIDTEEGCAYQSSRGYVNVFDYDGNSIDYDEEKALAFCDYSDAWEVM